MALSLITGSLSTTDISMATVSIKCISAQMALAFSRQSTSATTFCSSGWVEEIPGMKQMSGSIAAFGSKGVAYSDPLVWFTAGPTAFIGTADTACTLTGNINVFGDGITLVAAANSTRPIDFRSTGAIVSSWTVT